MKYPSLDQVEQATRYELGRWYRFLSAPSDNNEVAVMNRLVERFDRMGGFTPELSKQVGWE